MAGRIARLLMIAFVAAVMAGCGTSKPARFYTLSSTATTDGSAATPGAVAVGAVSIPAADDQPAFVVQVEPNRVEVDDFNRWAAPLGDIIARAVAGDLVVLLGSAEVTATPLANFDPAYQVSIGVQRFESVQGGAADPRGGMDSARDGDGRIPARDAPSLASRRRAPASTRSPLRTAARSRN